MPYELVVAVDTPGAPAPATSHITFDLPPSGTDDEARTIARGIRKGFRDAYDTRVRVVSFQVTGLSRDLSLAAEPATPAP